MTSDDTIHDSGNLPAVRPDTRPIPIGDWTDGEPATTEPDETWYAELARDDEAGGPAVTLAPPPEPEPPMTAEEHARLYLWRLWASSYLSPHHSPDWADPWYAQRFDQFIRAIRPLADLAFATGVPFCGPDAPEKERWDKWASAQEKAPKWAQSDAAAQPVKTRAAVTLIAQPDAPEAEQVIGARLAPDRLHGKKVRCRSCKRQHIYSDIEPYYGSHKQNGGQCYTCVLGPGAAKAGDGRDVMMIFDRLAAERGT